MIRVVSKTLAMLMSPSYLFFKSNIFMARPNRFFLSGATYHVMFRGNNGQSVFSSHADRLRFCFFMEDGIKQFDHSILAFCFMSNHVHLVIQLKDISLSKICQNLCFRYSQFYNYKNKTSGHLFQGRFKAVLVDDSFYLKELVRYIHLNPVRAKMVNDPSLYPWSSHQAYFNNDFTWLAKDTVLKKFGETRSLARDAFQHYVYSGIGVDCGIDFEKGNSGGILGSEEFIEDLKTKDRYIQITDDSSVVDLKTLINFVTSWYNVDPIKLLQDSDIKSTHVRVVIAYLVRSIKSITLRDLANYFERKESAICQSARRFEIKMNSSPKLKLEIEELKANLFETILGSGLTV